MMMSLTREKSLKMRIYEWQSRIVLRWFSAVDRMLKASYQRTLSNLQYYLHKRTVIAGNSVAGCCVPLINARRHSGAVHSLYWFASVLKRTTSLAVNFLYWSASVLKLTTSLAVNFLYWSASVLKLSLRQSGSTRMCSGVQFRSILWTNPTAKEGLMH